MPKEVIYGHHLPYGDDVSAVSVVEVRWSRDGEHVQVVSRCADPATLDTFKPNAETAAKIGWTTRAGGFDEATDTLTFADGFYVDLNRRGINDLIRHLRRARDQAYGRDE